MKTLSSMTLFKHQSTWRLVGLGVLSYGIYFAHYIKKQTARINELAQEEQSIPKEFVQLLLAMSYVSPLLLIASHLLDGGRQLELFTAVFDRIRVIMLIVWGFMARNRLNRAYRIAKDQQQWFHGLWTFLFSPMYFNYKINCICQEIQEHQAQPR